MATVADPAAGPIRVVVPPAPSGPQVLAAVVHALILVAGFFLAKWGLYPTPTPAPAPSPAPAPAPAPAPSPDPAPVPFSVADAEARRRIDADEARLADLGRRLDAIESRPAPTPDPRPAPDETPPTPAPVAFRKPLYATLAWDDPGLRRVADLRGSPTIRAALEAVGARWHAYRADDPEWRRVAGHPGAAPTLSGLGYPAVLVLDADGKFVAAFPPTDEAALVARVKTLAEAAK